MLNAFVHALAEFDVSTVGSFIGTLGFPIVLSIGLLYYLFTVQKEHKEELKEHKEETNQLKEAITKLEVVMSQILEHIRKTDGED